MKDPSMILPEDSTIHPDHWIIFNTYQMGYYRVNYDKANWNKIIAQFQNNFTVINALNRAQILNDGYSLARAGRSLRCHAVSNM